MARVSSVPPPPASPAAFAAADFLVVSNRLPPRENGGRKQAVGGLVSALRPAMASREGLWLGWQAGDDADQLTIDWDQVPRRAELSLPREMGDRYYAGFCNGVLWPFLHGMIARVRYADEAWSAYLEANERFADAVTRLATSDATVWVHDYHLMGLASALRRRGFRGKLGHFLHVPFPPLEIVEQLPRCEEILEGLLAFDLVGFHTERYARNFAESATELLPAVRTEQGLLHRGRRCRVDAFPIGIDPDLFAPTGAPEPEDDVTNLARALGDRPLLLGVDRLDYTKGICERLVGYERLLQRFPEWRGRVVLAQVAVPSREEVADYQDQRAKVEALVGRINGEFGEADWVPVRYMYRSYAPAELARLYRLARVGLVTPLRDGMNLVAKELVAAQEPGDPAALVLSRFAGAAVELEDAILTNPLHADGLAEDIDRALKMELPERQERHAAMLRVVRSNTATVWADRFMSTLDALPVQLSSVSRRPPPP